MSEEVKIYGTLVKGTVNKKLAYTDELFDKEYGNPPTEEDQKSQQKINKEISTKIANILADYIKNENIKGLIKDVGYSNNKLILTFQDKSTREVNLSDLAIDGMLADVQYLEENDTKPADFPQNYDKGYPCFYFKFNIEQSTKVLVVPTNDFIDINFNYNTTDPNNKNYAVKKDDSNNLYVHVPWTTYNAGSNIKIDNNNISSVVPKRILNNNGEVKVYDGTYHTCNGIVNALTIQFPYISDTSNAHGLAILFTSGNAPSIDYQKKATSSSEYSDYTPKKTIGFQIENNTTYEMTCTYVNGNWYVSAISFET